MEQRKLNIYFLKRITSVLIIAVLMLVTVSCKSKDPNPELRDKIYLDLKSELDDLNSELENSYSFLEMAYEEEKSAEIGSSDLAVVRRDIRKEKIKIEGLKQRIRYAEIRLERRKIEARIGYARSLDNETNWPVESEYQAYLAHKALRDAPRNWNERVPRLQNRINKYNRMISGEDDPEKVDK